MIVDNPVFYKEFLKSLRIRQQPIASRIGILAAVLTPVLSLYLLLFSFLFRETNWEAGQVGWVICVTVEYVLTCLIAPVIAANAITREKEQQTWEMLCFTNLRAGEIIFGKLAARLIVMLLILALLFPAALFCWGHAALLNTSTAASLSLSRFVVTQLVIFISALFYTTFGLFMSWLMKKTLFAIMMSYTFVIGVLVIGTFLITLMLSGPLNDSNLMYTCPLMWLNPGMLMWLAFNPDSTANGTLFLIYGLLLYVVMTMGMLWWMIGGFRRVVVEA